MVSPSPDEPESPHRDGERSSGADSSHHVRLAIGGDRESLGWVITRYSPLLRAQASWRLGPKLSASVDPDDLVAEAWLIALRRLGDLVRDEGRTTPRLVAFLGATILNLANQRIDEAVRQSRRIASPRPSADGASDPMANLQATITGAVTNAARTELATMLDVGLASLAPKDREIILLRIVEGLSNDAAARQLDESPNTVSHRYRRAIAKLREALPPSFLDDLTDE